MKKIIALLLAAAMLFAFAACNKTPVNEDGSTEADVNNATAVEDVKVGFIFLHDEQVKK